MSPVGVLSSQTGTLPCVLQMLTPTMITWFMQSRGLLFLFCAYPAPTHLARSSQNLTLSINSPKSGPDLSLHSRTGAMAVPSTWPAVIPLLSAQLLDLYSLQHSALVNPFLYCFSIIFSILSYKPPERYRAFQCFPFIAFSRYGSFTLQL